MPLRASSWSTSGVLKSDPAHLIWLQKPAQCMMHPLMKTMVLMTNFVHDHPINEVHYCHTIMYTLIIIMKQPRFKYTETVSMLWLWQALFPTLKDWLMQHIREFHPSNISDDLHRFQLVSWTRPLPSPVLDVLHHQHGEGRVWPLLHGLLGRVECHWGRQYTPQAAGGH